MDEASRKSANPAKARRVLLLQGGGALGAYQAGAYQALDEHDFAPQWIAGISIGAITAAIIAGNPPDQRVQRLREFWDMAAQPSPWQPLMQTNMPLFSETSAALIATLGVPGFFTPRFPPAQLFPSGTPDGLSYFDTEPLRQTLERLVDFGRINGNADTLRLSVGAVNIATGNFCYFDNTKQPLGPEHIMAAAALPPGFPAVKIGDDYYWDGGVACSTPLDYVLDDETEKDLLIFQVDLFSSHGRLPETLLEAAEREKDIRHSSRTRLNTDKAKQLHNARKALGDLLARLPEDLKNDPAYAELRQAARDNAITVVNLIYRKRDYEASSKDYDFSRANMLEHWKAGEQDVHLSMRHGEWLRPAQRDDTMVTWDLTAEAFR
ncbi:MAG: DUF3734 domain-containing protein [Rhodopseudomonas palustris]|nr:DUF3734 domain-containing protein [Rhodopseudomonas palustris]